MLPVLEDAEQVPYLHFWRQRKGRLKLTFGSALPPDLMYGCWRQRGLCGETWETWSSPTGRGLHCLNHRRGVCLKQARAVCKMKWRCFKVQRKFVVILLIIHHGVFWQRRSVPGLSKAFSHQKWRIKLDLRFLFDRYVKPFFFFFFLLRVVVGVVAVWPSQTSDLEGKTKRGLGEKNPKS